MKKLFLLGLAAVLFTACDNKPQRYFEESPEIETLKAGIKAYESQDWVGWKANFSDTAKIYVNSNKGMTTDQRIDDFKGMASVLSSYGMAKKGVFFEMVIDKDNETWVNYWGNWQGTLKANEKEVSIPLHLTLQFVNGKIVQEYAYFDASELNSELAQIEAINNMPIEEKVLFTTINNMVTVWNKNDQEQMRAISVPNLIRNANGARIANNQDEYATMMTGFFTGFPDFKVVLEDSQIKGNKAIITWRCLGTNTGEFLGNPPTNKKVNIQGISVWSFNGEGKAVQEDAFFDNLTMFNQLGIAPPKA